MSYVYVTHPGQDRSPISCLHHSCQWYCTTTCHLLVPRWCRSCTLYPGTQRGSGRALPQNCHRLQQCLAKQRHNNHSKNRSHCASTPHCLCAVFPVTHHDWDRIQTSCLGQSCLWWHTSGNHHYGPLWYSCHIPPPERRRGRRTWLRRRFLRMCTELSGWESGVRMSKRGDSACQKNICPSLSDPWPMISPGEWTVKLTFTWAEAVFLVSAVVSCGGAPRQVVRTAISSTGGVGFALESEGEVAHGTVRIPIASLHSLVDTMKCIDLMQCIMWTPGGDNYTWIVHEGEVSFDMCDSLPGPLPRVQYSSSSKWASPCRPSPGG